MQLNSKPHRVRAALKTLAVSATLTACAVGPKYERPTAPEVASEVLAPAQIPDQQLKTGQPVPAAWWTLFDSKALDELVQQARENNQNLQAAQSAVQQAQELLTARTGTRYPEVDLTAGAGRQKYGSQFLGPLPKPPPFTYYAFGPAVSYTLDYTGGVGRAIEQQRALTEYQQRESQAAHLSVTGNVVQQALAVASARAQIQALEEVLADDRRNVEMIEAANEAGSVSRVDVLSAQNQLASDETLLPSLKQQLSVAEHALAVLIGKTPNSMSTEQLDLATFTLPREVPVSLPSDWVRQRPDILAAESQLHAATAAVGIATANLYPRITLSATFGQQALEPGDLFDSANNAWGLVSSLTAPLFDGGKLRAEKRASVAALAVQSARYKQVVLESFAQVADALDALAHSGEQLEAQSRALAVAQQSLALIRESYNEGNVGVLQVLDSERLYQQARLGYVRAQAQRLQDTARLFVAMGGGVEPTMTAGATASATARATSR
jgi:NodT family efflux transporter outer membrane factor (OMF) lipoprotein